MAKIGEADIEVDADLKKFQKDLKQIKKELEQLKGRVPVTPTLAPGAKRDLQAQLKLIKGLKVDVTANITKKSLQESLNKIGQQATKPKVGADVNFSRAQLLVALKAVSTPRPKIQVDLEVNGGIERVLNTLGAINRSIKDNNIQHQVTNHLLGLQVAQNRGNLNNLRRQTVVLRDIHNAYGSFIPFIEQQRQGLRDTNNNMRRLLANILGIRKIKDPFPVIVGSAIASELLLSKLARIFQTALNFRRVMVQVGVATATAFAAAAQAIGAATIGVANLIGGLLIAGGLGLITIGVKLQLQDAEVQASVQNLKQTFNTVFTEASQSLKPVIIGFNNDLSAALVKQKGAFTNFFNTVAPGLQQLGKAVTDFLASEKFAQLLNVIGASTANFLEKFAANLPKIIDGIERIGKKFIEIKPRIQKALGPGVFSGLSVDKVIAGLERLTKIIEQAGPGIRAFKSAFGQVLGEAINQIDILSKTIGQVGPRLFGNLGTIATALVAALGAVGNAAVRAADTVLSIAGPAVTQFIKTMGTELANFTTILAEPLGNVLKRAAQLGTNLAPLLSIFAKLSAALEPVVGPIFDVLDAVAKLAVKIGGALVPVVHGFAVVLAPVISAIAFLARLILAVLGPAFDFIANHPWVGALIGGALAVIAPFKTLATVIGFVGKAFKLIGFGKTAGVFEKLASGATKLGGALKNIKFGGIAKALGNVGSKIAGFFKSFSSIGSTVAKVAGPLSRVVGLVARFAGPIGIIITLILNWRTVWDTLVKGFEIFKTAVAGVIAGIERIIGGFKKLFSGDIIGGLGDIFGGLKDILISALTGAFDGLVNILSGLWTILWSTLESIPVIGPLFEKIHGLITQGFNFLKTAFSGAGEFLSNVWDGLVAGATIAWNAIKAIFAPVIAVLGAAFSGIGAIVSGVWNFITSVFSAGVSLIGSILSGIVQFFSNPIEGIKTIVSGVWNFITSVFSAGVNLIGSILSGIGGFFSAAFSAVSGIVSGVFSTISSIIGGVVDFIGSKISGVGRFFGDAFNTVKSVVSGAIDFVKGLLDGLLSTLADIGNKVKSFLGFGDDAPAAPPPPKIDQAAVNAAADQVRQQSEAILAALKELGPKVQAELQNVTNIISQGFSTLGTTVGTAVSTIATTVGTALTTMATNLATTMTTLITTLLTQITTMAATVTTTLTTTLTTALTTLNTSFVATGTALTAAFTTIFTGLGQQATTFFTSVLPATVQGGVAALQANLTAGLTAAFEGAFAAIIPIVNNGITNAFSGGTAAAVAGMAAIQGVISGGIGGISAAFAPLETDLPAVLERAMEKAKAAAEKGIEALVTAVRNGAQKIRDLGQLYFDAGATIGQRLADGMRSKTAEVNAAANELAAAAARPMPHSPAKEGPLSGKGDPKHSGQVIVDRLVAGMREQIPVLKKAIEEVLTEFRRQNGQISLDPSRLPAFNFPQARGLNVGLGNAGAVGGALTGRSRANTGNILKSDTSANIGGNGTATQQIQIRPGNISVTLQGIDNPREFFNALSKELLTLTSGR